MRIEQNSIMIGRLHRINISRIRATICCAEACLRTAGVCVPIRYSYESRVINRMNRTPDRDELAITTVNVLVLGMRHTCIGTWHAYAPELQTQRRLKREQNLCTCTYTYIQENDDLSLLVRDRIYGNTWRHPIGTSCMDNSKCKWRANVCLIILACHVVIPTSAW